jgi:ubiquitin-conjugating enzyme E2 D/E
MTHRRLEKEYKNLKEDPVPNVSAAPCGDNLLEWEGCILGPHNTPYENGVFNLKIKFSEKYPFERPDIKFTTKIYHPNISTTGEICLDILKNRWTPSLTIKVVLLSICSLLSDPNPDDPLMPAVALMYKRNRERYNQIAKEFTNTYAC